MPPKTNTEIQTEILTQLALLNERFLKLEKMVESLGSDHESRLRGLEQSQNEIRLDVNSIKDRQNTFNLMQSTLTAVASVIVYYLTGRKS